MVVAIIVYDCKSRSGHWVTFGSYLVYGDIISLLCHVSLHWLTRWNRRLNLRLMPWSGPVISDHSDHGRSNEPMNPLWTRIHRLIWSTMIRLISERNAPLDFLKVLYFSFPVPVEGPNAKMTSLDEDNKSSLRSLAHFATKKRKTFWFALLRPTLKQTPPTLKREK